jgi:hypothetical protein
LRYARVNRDENHEAVIAELVLLGYQVEDLAFVGRGVPDLYVSRGGIGRWVEVKNPTARPGRKRGATQAAVDAREAAFRDRHPGLVIVATSADEVAEAFRIL